MNVSRSTSLLPRRRKLWRNICAAGAALSAAMLGVSIVSVLGVSALPAGTPATAGFTVSPSSGDSSTEITFRVTSPNNVCPGDSATGNYRWQTYLVPASVDAATLTYNSSGPIAPAGVSFVSPMYGFLGQEPAIEGNTAVSTGQITGVPTLGFGVFTPGQIAAGQYKVGFACTRPPSPGQPGATERYWQQTITVVASATGGPAQFTWSIAAPPTSSTTTTVAAATTTTTAGATTTTVPAATTTTVRSTTTTTVAGATTTTVAGATTTTTVAGATTTTAVASGGPTTTFGSFGGGTGGSFGTGSGGSLPVSGGNGLTITVWAILLVVFGRMTVLLARPIRVIPAELA